MPHLAFAILTAGLFVAVHCAPALAIGQAREEAGISHETIVLIRHGEMPPSGLGQLNCQGLNRSLALATALLSKFDKPDYMMAPNPAHKKSGGNGAYDYIPPLATIEPMAISLGLPIHADYGFDEIDRLQNQLLQPDYTNALVIVAWDHKQAEQLARNILRQNGGNASEVPHWMESDYDSMYVISIDRKPSGTPVVSFDIHSEGLHHMSETCPTNAILNGTWTR